MMKRQYEVPESEAQREDDSFKLCFGTMLVFLALMVLTCVCFWPRNMVEKKVSYSDIVHDSWSQHLDRRAKTTTSSTAKPIPSTETASSTTSNSRRTVPLLDKLSTEKTTSVHFTPTTEVPETSEIINSTNEVTLLGESEFTYSPQTNSVLVVTESEKTTLVVTQTADGEETIEGFVTSETTFKSTSESSTGSSTLLVNINVDTFPDSSENTIPYSSSLGDTTTESSSTFDHFKSDTSEGIETKMMMTELSVGYSANTEETIEPTRDESQLTSETDDDATAKEYDVDLMIANNTEESSNDSLGSDLVLEDLTANVSLPSTNDVPTIDYDYPSFSWMDDKNSTGSSALNGVLKDFVPDSSTTESSCPKCPESVCPVCLIQACPTAETTSAPVGITCKTKQCHVAASRLLSMVDFSVDPCDDFYSYSCGGLLDSPVLLEADPSLDVWNRIEKAVKNISSASPSSHQKLKNYYDGCVNYDKLVTIEERKTQGREVLERVGKFVDVSTTPEVDLTELLVGLFKLGRGTHFSIGLDVDSTNSSQFQVVVSLPDRLSSHFLTPRERSGGCRYKADDVIPLNLTEAYEVHINCMNNFSEVLDTTRKALLFFELFDNNSSQLIQDILMSVELDLFELLKGVPPPNLAQEDVQSKSYTLLSKLQLESEIPQIAWGYLLNKLFNIEFDDTTSVQVYFMDYIKDVLAQLQTKSSRSIHNSLLAVFAHDLYSDVAQTHDPFNRERYCLRVTASLLPTVTSNLYLTTFPPDVDQALRQQVMLIYQQLVSVMESRISAAVWLDEKSLNELMKNLRSMSIQLPEMFSDSQLSDSLGKCDLNNQQYFEDSVCLLQQLQSHMFALYSMDPHATEAMWPYFLTSFSTKPLFIYGLNTFLIPHTAVAPVYDKEMPKHVVLAQLGNILARGIGHSFDHTGIKFAASGDVGEMLSEATLLTYENMVNSSNLQFSLTKSHREADQVYTYSMNPQLTLNERLTDITAANLSLSLLLESEVEDSQLPWIPFSPKQVYFLTLAQSFCSKKKVPEIFTSLYEGTGLLPFDRVLNLAANSEQFAEVFHCQQGTNMNIPSELKTRPFPLLEKAELYTDIP